MLVENLDNHSDVELEPGSANLAAHVLQVQYSRWVH